MEKRKGWILQLSFEIFMQFLSDAKIVMNLFFFFFAKKVYLIGGLLISGAGVGFPFVRWHFKGIYEILADTSKFFLPQKLRPRTMGF